MNVFARAIGAQIARFLNRPSSTYAPPTTNSLAALRAVIRPGDVLLVEGDRHISTAIKYLTQSTWSHAALCIAPSPAADAEAPILIEADMEHGVELVPLTKYGAMHTRICRPVGLTAQQIQAVVNAATQRCGHQYDLKNVIDLGRFLFPLPFVPPRFRRRLLALGSGDPTRAICSTLIAQAFATIGYPVAARMHHYSLVAPRDFDTSPWFEVVKPSILLGDRWQGYLSECPPWAPSNPPALKPSPHVVTLSSEVDSLEG
jgi:hypothetical protein